MSSLKPHQGRSWLAAAACVLALGAAPLASAAEAAESVTSGSAGQARWVATWSSAPIAPGLTTIDSLFDNDRSRAFANQTVRHVVRTSVGGRRVRVRLSNAFGQQPLRIGAAQVARRSSFSSIHASSNRRLTFNGQPTMSIPAGAVAVSDAVELEVAPGSDLAVSIYLPGSGEQATFHEFTLQTSYIADGGNFTGVVDLPNAVPTPATYYLTVVEVQPADPVGTLVVLGDSIAQGGGSTPDANRTWPERLSARLNPNPQRPRLSVINQGVGCGRLLWDFCGPGGAARFDRDVLSVAGANRVVIALGLNDIMIPTTMPNFGHPRFAAEAVSAAEIITGLQQLVQRARASGFKVFGATIAPLGSSTIPGVFTPENEAKRQAVNRWIRTGGAYDGLIDIDAIVRDPANPLRLNPVYDADGVHFSDAGYEAVANAVNLGMLF
jgi:lysophospholipase L1-like esterase